MDYIEKFYEQLVSTNEFALANLSELDDRTIIYAETQTNGHGRFNRTWISDIPNNIYATIVLKPTLTSDKTWILSNLTQYLSVILCETIEKYGVKTDIKWPNDVLVNGKKIAGILAQSSIIGNKLNGIIIGFGINLNMPKEQLSKISQPATSLNLEINKTVDKKTFSKQLADAFFEEYDTFCEKGFEQIKSRYCSRCSFLSKEISITNPEKQLQGIAKRINDDGSLEIELREGNINKYETVRIGDLTCIKQ